MARPPKITNAEILAAAREVFLAQGMGASTLDIAERAGISEASIFKRFSTKQALFLAAIGITETPQWVKVMESQTPTADIKTELTEICTQMLAFYQEVLPRVMMMMAPGTLPNLTQSPPPPIRDSQLLAEFLERAIDLGYLKACNSSTIAHAIVGAITNYIAAETIASQLPDLSKDRSLAPAKFLQSLIEMIWSGIAPD
jgi:AcrR family transcriptional regulator